MNVLIDAQLPPALCRWLEARGHEATHIAEALSVSATTPKRPMCASTKRSRRSSARGSSGPLEKRG